MCRPASFVLTKDRVFWGSVDESHEAIIAEHNLHADGARGANIVRVELVPPGNDFRVPIEKWDYCLDQDVVPGWYFRNECENRTRAEAVAWLAEKVVLPGETRKMVGSGMALVVSYGTVQEVYGGGTVQRVYSGGTVQEVYASGTVQEVYGSGTVQEVYGSGTVQRVYAGGTVQRVYSGATVQAVYDGGTVQRVYDGGTVQRVYAGGTVQEVYDGGTVITYVPLPTDILRSAGAVLVDRSGATVKCYTGQT